MKFCNYHHIPTNGECSDLAGMYLALFGKSQIQPQLFICLAIVLTEAEHTLNYVFSSCRAKLHTCKYINIYNTEGVYTAFSLQWTSCKTNYFEHFVKFPICIKTHMNTLITP